MADYASYNYYDANNVTGKDIITAIKNASEDELRKVKMTTDKVKKTYIFKGRVKPKFLNPVLDAITTVSLVKHVDKNNQVFIKSKSEGKIKANGWFLFSLICCVPVPIFFFAVFYMFASQRKELIEGADRISKQVNFELGGKSI